MTFLFCLGVGLLGSFCLRPSKFLVSGYQFSLLGLGNFQLYFFKYIFNPLSLPSPSGIPAVHRLAHFILSHRFSSVAQSCPTLCDPMNHSTPQLKLPTQVSISVVKADILEKLSVFHHWVWCWLWVFHKSP